MGKFRRMKKIRIEFTCVNTNHRNRFIQNHIWNTQNHLKAFCLAIPLYLCGHVKPMWKSIETEMWMGQMCNVQSALDSALIKSDKTDERTFFVLPRLICILHPVKHIQYGLIYFIVALYTATNIIPMYGTMESCSTNNILSYWIHCTDILHNPDKEVKFSFYPKASIA